MRCWWCGAEPYELIEITTLGDVEPQYLPHWKPAADHRCRIEPPTVGEMMMDHLPDPSAVW